MEFIWWFIWDKSQAIFVIRTVQNMKFADTMLHMARPSITLLWAAFNLVNPLQLLRYGQSQSRNTIVQQFMLNVCTVFRALWR